MEDTNSCPAFIERQELTSSEIQHSPNLSRLSMRFGSSVLNGERENDENSSPLRLDTPPTPPYRRSRLSPKRTPPSPTVLRDISNTPQTPSGVPPFIKRRCMYSPRRSNSVSSIPVRRLYDIYEQEGIRIGGEREEPQVSSTSRKRPYLTNSTSSLPSLPDCLDLGPLPLPTPILVKPQPNLLPRPPRLESRRPPLEKKTGKGETSEEPMPIHRHELAASTDSLMMPLSIPLMVEDKHEEERVHCILPTIPGSSTDYNRINAQTLQSVIDGQYDDKIEKYVIMDCRYEYEYVGGHIQSAIHMSPEQIFDYFREMPEPVRAADADGKRRLVIIMHCEYSTVRAPACIRLLRHYDRSVNLHRGYSWPLCSFPDVYLLDGGYRKFFDNYKTSCEPQNYVPENAKQHQQLRVIHKRTRKEQLRRSQSFSA
jgi:rhodanese-related sulfurtransferase